MCGITFFLSKVGKNIIPDILNSIYLIQNRGYDSMGICYFDNNKKNYNISKKASSPTTNCFTLLENNIKNNNIESHIALGHTRWATHGPKTDINAHPHISYKNNIILVHNGIINNFYEIKTELLEHGFLFKSETDSEVIANLIEYCMLNKGQTIENAIKETTNRLEGTWALIIIDTLRQNTVYMTRKGSPLLLGNNNEYIIATSEINGFCGLLYDYIVLDNHDIIKIEGSTVQSINNNIKSYSKNVIKTNAIPVLPEEYNHWMLKEIMEQQETIQKAYNYGGRIINNIVRLGGLEQFRNNKVRYLYLIGCGTSYNAALLGEIYFNSCNNFIIVKACNASDFNEKSLPNIVNYSCVLCMFFSQSGETIDVYNVLKLCKSKGCQTMGVINKVDSLIARMVDCGVYLNAGSEISVASTKSFTSMCIVLSLIQMWFFDNYSRNATYINELRTLSSTITTQLYDFNFLKQLDIIKNYIISRDIKSIFILGSKKLYPIALEASLKIKEVCYIHTEGFSGGSLKHGPFALLDKTNLTLLLIDSNDDNIASVKSTFYEIKSRNTNIIPIINSEDIINELELEEGKYLLLKNMKHYNEIIFIVALQYLAYNISISKGINPDMPRNLAKVVTVE